jgi:uncharacterized protein (DUF1499 family)
MVNALKTFFLAGALGLLMVLGMPQPAQATTAIAPLAALPGFKAVFGGTRPTNIGVQDGHLAACPKTPNCVVSQGADAAHAIAPLTYTGAPAEAMATLATVVAAQPRSELITQTDDYLYVEFTSRLMGFMDDIEFYADPTAPGTIQMRAAARLGESDLGVNRQRLEDIRAAFQEDRSPSA